jgi:rSAM/selenodomain-associated transferase 1
MARERADGLCSAVVIMAKAPRPGEVKTRLCPPLSRQQAATLYRCFLLDKIAQVDSLHGSAPALSYGPPDSRAFFQDFAPPHFLLVPQLGADLGGRLLSTFIQLFRQGFEQVLAIDSDTPTLPTAYLQHALEAIAQPENDVVLGPTEDGGYYLIGLRRAHRELFEDMPWSTPQVLGETLRRAEAQRLHAVCIEAWFDVDTPDDLQRLQNILQASDYGHAPHTQRFLLGYR